MATARWDRPSRLRARDQEPREHQQPAVGPALPLDAQRTEVGRRRAVAEPLGVVLETPAVHAQVEARLGVLDDRAVLDVVACREAVVRLLGHDGVERRLADDRVGSDPEGGVVVRQPLVDDVLQVGRRAGDPLEARRRSTERRVRGLDDRDVGVLGSLEERDEPEAVLGQQHAVGVERQHVVGVRHLEIERSSAHRQVDRAARGLADAIAATHQAQVAVEVHGLVRLVRERGEALALEAREVGPEDPDEAAVEPAHARRADLGVRGDRVAQRSGDGLEVDREGQDDLVHEERVDVVGDVLVLGHAGGARTAASK